MVKELLPVLLGEERALPANGRWFGIFREYFPGAVHLTAKFFHGMPGEDSGRDTLPISMTLSADLYLPIERQLGGV